MYLSVKYRRHTFKSGIVVLKAIRYRTCSSANWGRHWNVCVEPRLGADGQNLSRPVGTGPRISRNYAHHTQPIRPILTRYHCPPLTCPWSFRTRARRRGPREAPCGTPRTGGASQLAGANSKPSHWQIVGACLVISQEERIIGCIS